MSSDFLRVYVAAIKDFCDNETVPAFRQKELQQITNAKVIAEKRAGYGLLKYAVRDVFGYTEDFSEVSQTKNRKPLAKKYCFSISHSGEICAVALSNKNVGVDVEKIDLTKNVDKLKKFILHESENDMPIHTHEQIFALFTRKEATYKLDDNEKLFLPRNISTKNLNAFNATLKTATENYALACVGEAVKHIKVQILSVGIVLN